MQKVFNCDPVPNETYKYVDLTFCQKHADYVVNKSYAAHNSNLFHLLLLILDFLIAIDYSLNYFCIFLS